MPDQNAFYRPLSTNNKAVIWQAYWLVAPVLHVNSEEESMSCWRFQWGVGVQGCSSVFLSVKDIKLFKSKVK